jgi:hypothetical protein
MSEPIHIISLGAGVQSSVMALMAARGEITPMPTAAIFADTQDEPASVYRWLDWLEKQLPFPVYRVTVGKISEFAVKEKINQKTGKPYYSNCIPAFIKGASEVEGRVGRYCTRDFKVIPIIRQVKRLAKAEIAAWRRERNENKRTARILGGAFSGASTPRIPAPVIVQWIGISLDEVSRMKPSRDAFIVHRWPMVDLRMKRHDCLAWMEKNGFPKPPRSACKFCPFKSNHEWRKLRDEEPDEFRQAVEFEARLQVFHGSIVSPGKIKGIPFLHRSLRPLSEVDLRTDFERGQNDLFNDQFNNECEGMCGV